MYKIQTLNKISAEGLSGFDAAKFQCADSFDAPDAIIVRSASMHEMTMPESLKAIARAGAGVNNIPIDACTAKGIVVFNTPGANANAVKELVICAMLLSSRKIVPSIGWCNNLKGSGDEVSALVEKGKNNFVGPEIFGKTLGLIGLGAIGLLVANAAVALGMKVVGYDPYLSDAAASKLDKSVKILADKDTVLAEADYISLHAPATAETKGMINKAAFSVMKKGVRIMNFSRADLVNSDDLIAALADGSCASYATDFPTDAQLGVEGVIAIPHLGASTPESEENCAVMAVAEISAFLEQGTILNSVNFPNLELVKSGTGSRICVLSEKNVESEIIAALEGAKVLAKATAEKKAAYTIIDIEGNAAEFTAKIQAIAGVLGVRVI